MDDCNRAQAAELIRALHSQLREMTTQLTGLQPNGGSETRVDAATLRRDIQEAQAHIDRLQRCYLASPAGALTRA